MSRVWLLVCFLPLTSAGSSVTFLFISDFVKFCSRYIGISPNQAPHTFFAASYDSTWDNDFGQYWEDHHPEMAYPLDINGPVAYAVYPPSTAIFCANINDWQCGPSCATTNLTRVMRYEFQQTGAAVLVGILYERVILITFRGTTTNMEARRNAFFSAVSRYCDDCLLHRGFLSHWTYMKRWVFLRMDYISKLLSADKGVGTTPVLSASLSLGAACTELLGADLPTLAGWGTRFEQYAQGVYEADEVVLTPLLKITYGCPRVGNAAFAQYVTETQANSSYRLVHYRDVVPHMPPVLTGYLHGSPALLYDGPMQRMHACYENIISRRCNNEMLSYSWGDHLTYYAVNLGDIILQCGGHTDGDVAMHESYDLLLLDLTT